MFLLRFVRTQPRLRVLLLVLVANSLGYALVIFPIAPFGLVTDLILTLSLGGVVNTLPYLADRLLAGRFDGLLRTLVFPAAQTTAWYVIALTSPDGTILNPAFTQYGDLPLMQLASVFGPWGIIFLITWFASVANEVWQHGFIWRQAQSSLLLFGGLLVLVFAGGAARVALFAPQGETVRVAGMSALHDAQLLPSGNFSKLLDEKTTEAQRQGFRPALNQVDASLLTLTEQEARAGAKMVVWPESGATVLQEDEADFLQRAQTVAQTNGIYLVMGLGVLLPSEQPPFGRDESVLITPNGQIFATYQKRHPTPDEFQRLTPGNGPVPVVTTPYGRLATVVCQDLNFLDVVHRVGQANADMVLAPTGDWREIDPYHSQVSTFTAIETGASLVDPATGGRSVAVDYLGQVLATTDYFTTDPQILVAYIPRQGVHTIYATIGDSLAWLSIVALVVLIGMASARRRAS